MLSDLFSLRLIFDRLKSESAGDVSATRIGDIFPYGFPQTELVEHSVCIGIFSCNKAFDMI